MHRPDRRQAQTHVPAPSEEAYGGAGVWIADLSGEELDIAVAGPLPGGGDQYRQDERAVAGNQTSRSLWWNSSDIDRRHFQSRSAFEPLVASRKKPRHGKHDIAVTCVAAAGKHDRQAGT